jgi:glycosyltransferase involved in cell wall biosynthesis
MRCIYLGRLDPEKRIDLMIHGFARLEDRSGVSLTIVGDGDCRSELEALVLQLGLRDCVTFSGAVGDVTASLQAADVFVSTSISEGMSNALLEAMSFGLMPLVSDVSGVADVVGDNRSGLLFVAGDLEAFTRRLHTALTMPAVTRRAFGRAARTTVEERFGIDCVAERHVALYETLQR